MEDNLKLVDLYSWIGPIDSVNFDCGVSKINNEAERLFNREYDDRRVLGLVNSLGDLFGVIAFSLGTTSLIQKEHPLERYPVLSLDLLAIQKDYQNNKYGSRLLASVLRIALTMNCLVPIRGIYLEALTEASEFYEHRGFEELHPFAPGMEFQKLFMNIASIEQLDLYPYSNIFNLE